MDRVYSPNRRSSLLFRFRQLHIKAPSGDESSQNGPITVVLFDTLHTFRNNQITYAWLAGGATISILNSTLWSSLSFLTPKSLQASLFSLLKSLQYYFLRNTFAEYICLCAGTMSKAIHEPMNNENTAATHSLAGIQGYFPIDEAVLDGRTFASITHWSILTYNYSDAQRDESDICGGVWILCLDHYWENYHNFARWDYEEIFHKGQPFQSGHLHMFQTRWPVYGDT